MPVRSSASVAVARDCAQNAWPATKATTAPTLRTALRRRGIQPIIPSRSNRIRTIPLDKARYRERNVIERCINWLKQWRRVATRYEKLAANYAAMILIAASMHFVNLLL